MTLALNLIDILLLLGVLAGMSTVMLAGALKTSGGHLCSVEHDAGFLKKPARCCATPASRRRLPSGVSMAG